MEAEMSQELQLARWRPKRANGVMSLSSKVQKAPIVEIPVQVQGPMFQLSSQTGKIPSYSTFPFYAGFQ